MEINENVLLVALIVIGLILVVSLFNLLIGRRILKRYSGKLIKVVSIYEIESASLDHKYKTTFFNNNFSDVKVQNIGYVYNNQEFSFFTEIKEARNVKDTDYVIVEDNITIQQTYEEIKKMVLGILNDKSKVKQIYAFLTDSDGNVTKKRARQLRKNIRRKFKEELKEEKLKRREQGISWFDDVKTKFNSRPKKEKPPKKDLVTDVKESKEKPEVKQKEKKEEKKEAK